MKALLLTLIFSLSFNAQAMTVSPEQLSPEQKVQLLEVLNQMSPEMLDSILSDEAYEWYIDQFTRNGRGQENDDNFKSKLGRADIGYDAFNDTKAPTFN